MLSISRSLKFFVVFLALAWIGAGCEGTESDPSRPPEPTVSEIPPESPADSAGVSVDPCSDSALATPQRFPEEWIEDNAWASLLYDSKADRILLGLGTRIFERADGGTDWKILKDVHNPVTEMALDGERGLLFLKSSGEGPTGLAFLILMELDLTTGGLSFIMPPEADAQNCRYADLVYDPAFDRLYLPCLDRILSRSAEGVWSTDATNAEVGGNSIASLAVGTTPDGQVLLYAAVHAPSAFPSATGSVFFREGLDSWVPVPNSTWHEMFPTSGVHRLLLNSQTSELFSMVRNEDPAILRSHKSGGWEEAFRFPTPNLPSEGVLDPLTNRLYMTDLSCTLSYLDGEVTEIGSLGPGFEIFSTIPSICPGNLALDAGRGILYTPLYTNPCINHDGACPRLTDVVGVCLPK